MKDPQETLPPAFDKTMYVEARIGSANYRGESVRCLWDDARHNRVAEDVIREQAALIDKLKERHEWSDDDDPTSASWLGINDKDSRIIGSREEGNYFVVYLGFDSEGIGRWCACVNGCPYSCAIRVPTRGHVRQLARLMGLDDDINAKQ